jgi:hypothetical protein
MNLQTLKSAPRTDFKVSSSKNFVDTNFCKCYKRPEQIPYMVLAVSRSYDI